MTLRETALAGAPLTGETVVDCHMHPVRVAQFFSGGRDMAEVAAKMDRIGIGCGLLSCFSDVGGGKDRHEWIKEVCARWPGRFFGYLSPDPHDGEFREKLEKWAADPVFVGVKLHPVVYGVPLLCNEHRWILAFASEHGLPVLFHTWGCADICEMERAAEEFPKAQLIMGHSGGERDGAALAIKMAAEHENLWLDTTRSFVYCREIEHMTEGAGDGRILFGSDATWNSQEAAVGRILLADIPDESKRKILGLNAKKLFHLPV